MNKPIVPLFVICLIAGSCVSPTSIVIPSPSETPPPDPLDTSWDDRSIFTSGLVSSAQSVLNELDGASVYHIEFTIDDDLFHVTGTEEVRYTNREDGSLDEILFRLFPNILGGSMQISNLQTDGLNTKPNYELENSLMIVPLLKPLNPDESIVIRMEFSVDVPQSVDLNYGVLAYYDNILALAHAYPMIAVYNDEGWNAEIPSQDGDITFSDTSFYIVKITAPKELTLVTSGRQIDHTEAGQVQVVDVASGPARDFYLAASPEYQEDSLIAGETTIRSYSAKGLGDGSQFALDVAARALKIYSQRYTPYPYTEFDIVATPTLALGIEYPGLIAITSWAFDMRGDAGNDYLESTVAHEVGHQWFYNLVGDDQLDDPWLDESLTQFATLQYYTDTYGASGEEGFTQSLESRWEQVEKNAIPIGLPVSKYSSGAYGAIVYGRGPLFFVALKQEMGAEAFDAFLGEYTQTLSWEISTPGILQSLAENNCACDLGAIFNEWVYP